MAILCAAAVVTGLFGQLNVFAADYPEGDIQIVVPVGAGGDTDANARLLAKFMEEELDVALPVVNIKGGSGTLGMEEVRNSEPDGYTALFFHAEAMLPKIAGLYDYNLGDFKLAGVCLQANTTLLITHNDSGFTTLDEFLEAAKANTAITDVFEAPNGKKMQLFGEVIERKGKRYPSFRGAYINDKTT